MNVDVWLENDVKMIGDCLEKVELFICFWCCYNIVDMKKVDIDNCFLCYNIDFDCKVYLLVYIY